MPTITEGGFHITKNRCIYEIKIFDDGFAGCIAVQLREREH